MRNCPCCNKNNNFLDNVISINLSLINSIKLNKQLRVYSCSDCHFYFSDSNNTQDDYNNYYKSFNRYNKIANNPSDDKNEKCVQFLCNNLDHSINNILDYGSGNGILSNLLSNKFVVDQFDIGMDENNKKYDCLILSHVLEHIYDLDNFIDNISKNINDNGVLYIEIPNAEFYSDMISLCPLQEINIEHINFFSKYALNKLMIKHNFYAINLSDDYFTFKKTYKYFIIRGLFKKNINNKSMIKYIENGSTEINNYNYHNLSKYKNIYVYGCGEFLFKILHNIISIVNVINIIDDNPCYLDTKINNIDIINFELLKNVIKDDDAILLTSHIYNDSIKTQLQTLSKKINIIEINNL